MIITKQISICFNTSNQYVNTIGKKDVGDAFIQVPFPVRRITIKEVASDFGAQKEYHSLINNDLFGGDACLGIVYIGSSLLDEQILTKNNIFVFNEPKIINGTYSFRLRNSQLSPYNTIDNQFTGDVADTTSTLTISAGNPPPVLNIKLGTGLPTSEIVPALSITAQLTATTFSLNRTVTPAYVAQVFTYPALSGCIQVVMEFSSE
jgi:hypothetical protein